MPRGFGPARIDQWMGQAERLSARTETVDLGFLVAFTTWEAMQARILAIALRRQGYSMDVAHEYLGRTIHNDRTSIRANFEVVFLRKPDQLRGLGHGWRRIEGHRSTRNLFTHGLGTADPGELRERTFEIVSLMKETSWLESTPVPRSLGDSSEGFMALGPVVSRLKRSATNGRTVEYLAQRMRAIRKGAG